TGARAAAKRKLLAGLGQVPFERLALLHERPEALDHVVGARLEGGRRVPHMLVLPGEIGARAIAAQRLDAADAGSAGAVPDAPDKPDIAGPAHMRAAAQFDRPRFLGPFRPFRAPHRDDTDLVAVFFAEQR